ncbi:MAG: hypothetical protein JJD92_10025 [Frankiaceae bacterium]|nr:hypothetical protein [Frankiaceae bacterium]
MRLAGWALALCPAVLLVTALPIGESAQLLAGALGLLLFAVGLTGLRQLSTGVGLPWVVAGVAVLGISGIIVGALFRVSGVAVSVPVVIGVGVVLYVSDWRAGDLSLLGLSLALGSGLAYVLDNVLHDDNGSQTDQAVPVFLVPSIALAVWVLGRASSISRPARLAVVLAALLSFLSLAVALQTRDSTFFFFLAPAAALLAYGLVASGMTLRRWTVASP